MINFYGVGDVRFPGFSEVVRASRSGKGSLAWQHQGNVPTRCGIWLVRAARRVFAGRSFRQRCRAAEHPFRGVAGLARCAWPTLAGG